MIMTDLSTILLSETVVSSGGTLCWMSPELLSSGGYSTRESDCYTLGMVIYEVGWSNPSRWSLAYPSQVLTGLRPFHHLHALTSVSAIFRGERPEKSLGADSLGFSPELWGLLQSCWSELSSTRPTARRLFDYLSPTSLAWVPPPVYPAIGVCTFNITDSESLGSLSPSLTNSADKV